MDKTAGMQTAKITIEKSWLKGGSKLRPEETAVKTKVRMGSNIKKNNKAVLSVVI